MALLNPETLLLTVGDFGFDGAASVHAYAQDPAASYGKTLAINIADGNTTIFTIGHRNAEGLYIDRSGTIWSTEHVGRRAATNSISWSEAQIMIGHSRPMEQTMVRSRGR